MLALLAIARLQLRMRREHAVEPYQVQPWARHQGRQPLHEFHRGEHDVGGALLVPRPRGFEFEFDLPFARVLKAVLRA